MGQTKKLKKLRFTGHFIGHFYRASSLVKYYSLIRLNGLGYRAWKVGSKTLVLDIGFSHYLTFELRKIPISCIIRKNRIFLFGEDKLTLNNLVNFIGSFKRPNPYNLKGIQIMKNKIFKKARKRDRAR